MVLVYSLSDCISISGSELLDGFIISGRGDDEDYSEDEDDLVKLGRENPSKISTLKRVPIKLKTAQAEKTIVRPMRPLVI